MIKGYTADEYGDFLIASLKDPYKDVEKIIYSIQNDYSIIHIYQLDIWKNKYNWKKILLQTIQQLTESTNRKVVFISSNDIYNTHISKLPKEICYDEIHPKM